MEEVAGIELSSLVGKRVLSAVGTFTLKIKDWGDELQDCESMSFTLDGITYTAVEDPSDGYRSSMRYLIVSSEPADYLVSPHDVVGTMRGNDKYGEVNDVLDLIDAQTGKVVLSVGTANTDDYYPYFVAEWHPENLAANAKLPTP